MGSMYFINSGIVISASEDIMVTAFNTGTETTGDGSQLIAGSTKEDNEYIVSSFDVTGSYPAMGLIVALYDNTMIEVSVKLRTFIGSILRFIVTFTLT